MSELPAPDPSISLLLALGFGVLMFIVEYYGHRHIRLDPSLIAGISVTYFFLIVVPELSTSLHDIILFEYGLVLIGFTFVHVSEKWTLQRVDRKAQEHVRELMGKEKDMEMVERNIETIVDKEIMADQVDVAALHEVSQVLRGLNQQNIAIRVQITALKRKIARHVSRTLDEERLIFDIVYHGIIGIIMTSLLGESLLGGSLFFLFAFLRSMITDLARDSTRIFSDFDIIPRHHESPPKKILSAGSMLMGIGIKYLLDWVYPADLTIIYLLFAFISGVILYTIVRVVIPEKEKGSPVKFLAGVIGFAVLVIILQNIEHWIY